MEKLFYTHEKMLTDLNSIYRAMHLDGVKADVVYGITRGGLIPAVHASHYFEVPMETIKVTTYDGDELGDCSKLVADLVSGKTVLIVDDICDTGNTLAYILSQIPEEYHMNSVFAALIHNEGCREFEPDYAATIINKVENPVWVVFPWEQ